MKGQMKIQQMAFMILAVFIFFVLVGLFFFGFKYKDVKDSYGDLQTRQAISSLGVIVDMTELNCDAKRSWCIDEDKLRVMSASPTVYEDFWPVSSIEVYYLYPRPAEEKKCPSANCSYYVVYDSGQEVVTSYSTYVSICSNEAKAGGVYEDCKIGKMLVGVRG